MKHVRSVMGWLLSFCMLFTMLPMAAFPVFATDAPAVPQNISAQPTGSGTVKLTWSLSEGATQYNVYQDDAEKGRFVYIGTSYSSSYTVKNLENGTEYRFKLVAVRKADGTTLVGAYSDPVSVVPEDGPAVPKNIVAAPAGSGVIKLSWDTNDTTTQHNIYKYDETKGRYAYIGTSWTDSYLVKNLTDGTEYSFEIVPVRKADGKTLVGPYSDPVTAVAVDGPAIPASITAKPAGSGTIVLSWTASEGATQYNIYKYDDAKGRYVYIGTSRTTDYTVEGLSSGTTYYFKVLAATTGSGLTFVGPLSTAATAKVK